MSQPITAEMVSQTKAARAVGGATTPASSDPMLRRSKDSAGMLPYWDMVDTIIDGIDAMREAAQQFLPKFIDEEQTEYDFRLKMTKMTNVYRDGIEGLASKPFEQEVALTEDNGPAPQRIKDFVLNVDGSSNTMNVFAGDAFFNGINGAIAWIFIDYSKPAPGPINIKQAREMGQRAYWSHVLARNVLDVQSKVINGEETLTYFKVFEPGDPDHIREFTRGDDGTVTWNLYKHAETRPQGSETNYVRIDGGVITIGQIPMVPFITGRRNGRTWKVFPPLKDAADLQIELYQGESGLKFAKTLTAYPMLAANGILPEKGADGKPKRVPVGPSRVLYSSFDAGTGRAGEWNYLEPSAESLKFLSEDNNGMIRELRELLRQPLTAQSGNITVITATVAANKARSAVKQWALLLKDALENALAMVCKYEGITDYKPTVHVFIEFDDFLEGEDIAALQVMREKRDISQETYWEENKRRGVLGSNFTNERERARLLKELPGDGPDNNTEDIDG